MTIDERAARAMHERVAQTLAYASTHYGYKPPPRSAPVAIAATPGPPALAPVKPAPISPTALAKAVERAELVRQTAEAERMVDAQAEAKASWKRVLARKRGKPESVADNPIAASWRRAAARIGIPMRGA